MAVLCRNKKTHAPGCHNRAGRLNPGVSNGAEGEQAKRRGKPPTSVLHASLSGAYPPCFWQQGSEIRGRLTTCSSQRFVISYVPCLSRIWGIWVNPQVLSNVANPPKSPHGTGQRFMNMSVFCPKPSNVFCTCSSLPWKASPCHSFQWQRPAQAPQADASQSSLQTSSDGLAEAHPQQQPGSSLGFRSKLEENAKDRQGGTKSAAIGAISATLQGLAWQPPPATCKVW